MNILVLNLPHQEEIVRRYNESYYAHGCLYPPIELLRVSNIFNVYLQNFYRNITFRDAMAEAYNIEDIKKLVKEREIHAMVTLAGIETIEEDDRLIRQIKEETGIKVIVIGYLPSLYPEKFPEYDVILGWNFETVLRDTLVNLPTSGINEFLERLAENAAHNDSFDPDVLVQSDLGDLDPCKYKTIFSKGLTAFTYFGFGCPYKCSFCIHSYGSEKYYPRSTENIIKELDKLHKKKYKNIVIMDDNFPLNGKRLYKINEFMRMKDMRFRLYGNSRIDLLDEEGIMLMKEMNFRRINIGMENMTPHMTGLYGKENELTMSEMKKRFLLMRKLGIESAVSLIFNPMIDSRKAQRESISKLKELKPTLFRVNSLVPYPGTAYHMEHEGEIDFSIRPFKLDFRKNNEKTRTVKMNLMRDPHMRPVGFKNRLKFVLRY